jgi:hypothetical protein
MIHKLWIKHYLTTTLLVAIAVCLLALPSTEVKADPPDPTSGPPLDIRTKLQPYQTPGVGLFEVDGWLPEEAPPPSVDEESPISTLGRQTFQSIADTTVLQGYPTLNAGNTSDMWAGYDRGDTQARIVRSLVKFNLTRLPPNQNITNATLRVRLVISGDVPGARRTITAYRITSSWSERGVTWNNKPRYGSAYGSTSIVHGAWGWYELDVTDLVKAWYTGRYPNYGIMLRGPEASSTGFRGFATRETSYKPQLIVEFQEPEPRVYSITPDNGNIDEVVHITNLAGANFQTRAAVKLTKLGEADINGTNVDVVSASKITCDLDLTGATAGAWDVVVTNPDSESGTLRGGFTVYQANSTIYLPIILSANIETR